MRWLFIVAVLIAVPALAFFATNRFGFAVILEIGTAVSVLAILLFPAEFPIPRRGSIVVNDRLRAIAYWLTWPGIILAAAGVIWFALALLIVPHSFLGEEIAVFPSLCLFVPGILFLGLRFFVVMVEILGGGDQ